MYLNLTETYIHVHNLFRFIFIEENQSRKANVLLQEQKVLVRNFIKAKYQYCIFVNNNAQYGFVLSSVIFIFAFQSFGKEHIFLHHSFANRSAKSKRVTLEHDAYLKYLSLITTFAQARNASIPCFIASTKTKLQC